MPCGRFPKAMARIDVIGCDAGASDTMAAPQRQLLSRCDVEK